MGKSKELFMKMREEEEGERYLDEYDISSAVRSLKPYEISFPCHVAIVQKQDEQAIIITYSQENLEEILEAHQATVLQQYQFHKRLV